MRAHFDDCLHKLDADRRKATQAAQARCRLVAARSTVAEPATAGGAAATVAAHRALEQSVAALQLAALTGSVLLPEDLPAGAGEEVRDTAGRARRAPGADTRPPRPPTTAAAAEVGAIAAQAARARHGAARPHSGGA